MSTQPDFGEAMARWADRNPTISGLVLIGSRERPEADKLWRADEHSDWDFQVIASRPKQFENGAWTKGIFGFELRAYAARTAIIGGVPKVSAVFTNAEADLVIIPAISARLLRWSIRLGLHKREGRVRRHVQDLAEVIRPGWRFLKGGDKWGGLYQRAVDDVPDPHLEDQEVRKLAEGFVCDYVWTLRKIARGELMTAQRMLFLGLTEANFRLMHELKQRRGERTFTKARRIERVAGERELNDLAVEAPLESAALCAAVAKSAATCRKLVKALVGETWHWPDVGQ
jgi:hypothetical protein